MNSVYFILAVLAWIVVGVLVTALLSRFIDSTSNTSFDIDPNAPADWIFVGMCACIWPAALFVLVLCVIGKLLASIVKLIAGF